MVQITHIQIDNYGPWTVNCQKQEHELLELQSLLYQCLVQEFAKHHTLVFEGRKDNFLALTNGLDLISHKNILDKINSQFPFTISMAVGTGKTPLIAADNASKSLAITGSAQSKRSAVLVGEFENNSSPITIAHIDVDNVTRLCTDVQSEYHTYLKMCELCICLGNNLSKIGALTFFIGGDNFIALLGEYDKQEFENLVVNSQQKKLELKVGVGTALTPIRSMYSSNIALEKIREHREMKFYYEEIKNNSYISINGLFVPEDLKQLSMFPKIPGYDLYVGFPLSKNNDYPINDLQDLIRMYTLILSCPKPSVIHYNNVKDSDCIKDVLYVLNFNDLHKKIRGIQFNEPVPVDTIKELRLRYPHLKLILSTSYIDANSTVNYLKNRHMFIDYILLDESKGKGQILDISNVASFVEKLDLEFPQLKKAVCGGLNHTNIDSVYHQITTLQKSISFDVESSLQNLDVVSIDRALTFINAFINAQRKKLTNLLVEIQLKKQSRSVPENFNLPYYNEIISVHPNVLRPTSDGKLFAEYLYNYRNSLSTLKILDMGCGSGYLGILLALGGSQVEMADVSTYATTNARENIEKTGLDIKVHDSDLFSNISGKYDVIVFNHPYFNVQPKDSLSAAICSSSDLLKRFFCQVRDFLTEDGYIIMSYDDIAGDTNDPKSRALEAGMVVNAVFSNSMSTGDVESNYYIYKFSFN